MTTEHTLLDTTGLICPEPIMLLHQSIRRIHSGDTIAMTATDPATCRDVANFCQHLGHTLLEAQCDNSPYYYLIQKK